jgi:hypothetical protein
MHDDREFEEYLAQFRPRQPRVPAPAIFPRRHALPLGIAAALTIGVSLGLYGVYLGRSERATSANATSAANPVEGGSAGRLTLGALTRVMRETPQEFDSVLLTISPTIFRDDGKETSALQFLARE